jgi:hypothetical protein
VSFLCIVFIISCSTDRWYTNKGYGLLASRLPAMKIATTKPYIPRMPDIITGSKAVMTSCGWKTAMAAIALPDFAVP